MAKSDNLSQLFSAKLASSGLTEKDADKLKFELIDKASVEKLALPAFGGFKMPYFDLKGKPTAFFRVRYLESTKVGFAALTKEKPLRYVQPKGTLNEIYLPPMMDWAAIAKDTKKPIIITEGELKAAKAVKEGFATIGLGGVWNFRSAQHNLTLLPLLEEFDWSERVVVIAYDSDSTTNPKVMNAENVLSREMLRRGADVRIGRVQQGPQGAKQGLDDLLVAEGKVGLREVLDKSFPFGPCEALFQLNTEVTYVRNPGLILRLDNLQRMAPRAFTDHAFATRMYTETQTVETKKGSTTKMVEKSAPKEWLKWPNRVEVEKVVYEPGQPRVFNKSLNIWPGWGCEPEPGDVQPWSSLLTWIFRGDDEARKWFEQWCAYPIQNPGVKLYQSPVLWGITHGTGKTLIGYSLFSVYGSNAAEIKDHHLQETHNEWAENKQFIMGDEITGGDKRGVADRLKSMVTQREIRLNPKYVPSYSVRDCINYYHTSNHPDSFFLEDNDRRYFIWEVKGKPLPREFYNAYGAWLKNKGPQHLFNHLLNIDLTGFDPMGHAPMTDSKREMIDTGKSDLAGWVAMLREDPDMMLRVDNTAFPFKMFRSEDLLKIYDPGTNTRVTANGLARELRKGGFERLNNSACVRTSMGHVRVWAIREPDSFRKLSGDEIGKYYDEERGQTGAHKNTQKKFKK